tara:strand:- start:206 stop:640 length:435 start_codon:yes stop_codon:yes gene_type:complete
MLGVVYNDASKYLSPVYPTGVRRAVAYVKDLFSKEQPVMCDEGINLRALTCVGHNKVSDLLNLLVEEGVDPTITRTTNKGQGWYAKVTTKENFLKVAEGHTVRYYALTVDEVSLYDNPFYNVERIISVTGERDDIHKKTKRKAA